MNNSEASIRQLTETVNTLANIVVKNESRYQSIEKSFRWMGIVFICTVLMLFYFGFTMVPQVQATAIGDEIRSEIREVKQHVKDLKKFVNDTEELVSNMVVLTGGAINISNYASSILKKDGENLSNTLATTWADTSKIIRNISALTDGAIKISHNISTELHSPEFQDEEKKIVTAMADILTLIHRLKLDSDALRTTILPDGTKVVNNGSGLISKNSIHNALAMIHREIQLMNTTMKVMTHAMGPTMGRMGTMMNQTPMMNTIPW
ncbi:hypothetical protein QUF50_03935 [Thiotrichales bacterium HSG1]|nr:hypothetical protein [Thiotrichales bacterium HSG1]